jgi:PAS domain S-box-containing protein
MAIKTGAQDRQSEAASVWTAVLRAAAEVARHARGDEEDVLKAVADALRALDLIGGVALLDSEGMLEVKGSFISSHHEHEFTQATGLTIRGHRFDPNQSAAHRRAIRKRRPIFSPSRMAILEHILPESVFSKLPEISRRYGSSPAIVAPLLLGEAVIGTVNVTAKWLTRADCTMVMALADHIAIAIGQARARTSMQAALELERLQHAVVEAVASELDLDLVLDRVLELAVEATSADGGAITLINEDEPRALDLCTLGLPAEIEFPPQTRDQGVIWEIIDTQQPLLLADYAVDPRALKVWRQAGVHAYLGLPLIVGEITIGSISVMGLDRETVFGHKQAEALQAISRMAAIAIRNAKLLTEAMRRAEEAQALMQTARSVSATLDYERVLKLIAEQARDLLRADASRIHILDPETGLLRCLVALDTIAPQIMALEIPLGEGLVGYVAESGEPLLVNDPDREGRGLLIPDTRAGEFEVLVLVPLIVRQRTLGVMTVRRLGVGRPFALSDVDLLSAFAAHAAVAIEHSHLFNQIQAQAQRLESEIVERTQELALSEARYRALVETSLAGIMQLDLEGRITYANQALADIIGLPVADIIGRSLASFHKPQEGDRSQLGHQLQSLLRGESTAKDVMEIDLRSHQGETISCLLAVSVITDEVNVQGMTALVLDISDRKALEAALQSERDRLETILATIGDAVMVTDPEGHIEYVNPAWTALTGYPAEEAIGHRPSIHKSGEHDESFYARMWDTILRGEAWRGELVNRRKDGTIYDAAVNIQPLLGDHGEIINFVGVQHDISALKEVDRLKSQFVSDVSHELRTPLTNIQLYLDLIAQTEDPERNARYLDTLSRESDRLRFLIDDLLSLSRLEAGTTGFHPAPVDINALLASLVADRRGLAAQKNLSLRIEPQADLPPVSGDARLLGQVFTNLLTNAMNYTPASGQIVLRTRSRESDGVAWVTAEVVDTGLGIPKEERPMIFQRFFRGYASRNTAAPGTGLGLAICREIVQLHSGRIEVQSSLDRGATFRVWLPVAETALGPLDQGESPST